MAKKGHTYVQWMIAFLADTTMLTYGLQVGWVSSMTNILKSEESPIGRPITDMELSWVASLVPISAVVGVGLYVYIADRFGRRAGVLAMAVPQALCWIIKLSFSNLPCLMIARICAGIPAGGCFILIPMYVKEMSQDSIRGVLVSLFSLMQNVGIFLIYAMGPYFEYYTVLWMVMWIPLITILAFIKAPESPAFLIKNGKHEEAASTLAYLKGLDVNDKEVQNEISYMQEQEKYFQSLPDVTYTTIFKNKIWNKGLVLILILISAQAWNGSFAIITYATTIMAASGVTISPELQTLSIPAVMILGSFVMMGCVEKTGRKVILSGTFVITTASFTCLGVVLAMQDKGSSVPSWLPIFVIIVTVFAYSLGVAPMPYVMMSEMFNFYIRAKVLGCIVTVAWFISFVQVYTYNPIHAALGSHTFFVYAGINLLGAAITLVLLPETRGKSVEEIEMLLSKKPR